MVEAPGTAPGSATPIPKSVYRHSRRSDTHNISRPTLLAQGAHLSPHRGPVRLCGGRTALATGAAQGEAAAGPRAYPGVWRSLRSGASSGSISAGSTTTAEVDPQNRKSRDQARPARSSRLSWPEAVRAPGRRPGHGSRGAAADGGDTARRRETTSRLALAEAAGAAAPAGAGASPFEAVVAKAVARSPPAPAIHAQAGAGRGLRSLHRVGRAPLAQGRRPGLHGAGNEARGLEGPLLRREPAITGENRAAGGQMEPRARASLAPRRLSRLGAAAPPYPRLAASSGTAPSPAVDRSPKREGPLSRWLRAPAAAATRPRPRPCASPSGACPGPGPRAGVPARGRSHTPRRDRTALADPP